MVVGAKVCELTDGFLWFVCGLYVAILTSPLRGLPLITYTPRGRGVLSLPYISIAHYMQKGGRGFR